MNIMPTYDHIMITIRTENKNDHLDIENDHLDIENAYVIEVQIDAKHK